MPLNTGPNPNFMQKILGATNAVGQSMGGPMGQASRMTMGMNQNRLNRRPLPSQQTMPNSGMMPRGLPNGMGMGGRMGSPGMSMGQPPTMPFVQGPSTLPDFQLGRNTGGMNPMGGFSGPQIDTGNVMNDDQMSNPMGQGLWNKYQTMQRPMMNSMFR